MTRTLAPDPQRIGIAGIAAAVALVLAVPAAQIGIIALGALAGLWLCRPGVAVPAALPRWAPGRRAGIASLLLFGALLAASPLVADRPILALAAVFYRTGALVFGGGHVVLPLLHAGLVPGWVGEDAFLAGYGAVQAMPGPLFTISTFLGAVAVPDAPLPGAVAALLAIFLPGLLLVTAALPFRAAIAESPSARSAMAGVNAAVVGILAAALYDPLWKSGVGSVGDAVLAAAGFGMLTSARAPPIAVVGLIVAAAVVMRIWV